MADKFLSFPELRTRIKDEIKKAFPKCTFSIISGGGTTTEVLRIYLLKADFDPLTDPVSKDYYSVSNYKISTNYKLTEDGKQVFSRINDIVRKHTHDRDGFYYHMYVGKHPKPFEQIKSTSSTPRPTSSGGGGSWQRRPAKDSTYDYGVELTRRNGWIAYEKTLRDGRKVTNLRKEASTPPNKSDWDAIRGELYTETLFKWDKAFQVFERWGSPEMDRINKALDILGKYFKASSNPEPNPAPQPAPQTPPEPAPAAPSIETEKIMKAIAAFEILAAKGNTFAQQQIEMLRQKLNA